MSEESARLRIPYIAASQAQKHVTHNEALTLLDTLVQLSVIDKDLTAPPVSPTEGDCYIVAATGTGAWTGWDSRIVRYIDGEWRSYLPGAGSGEGWLAYVQDEDTIYVFTGAAWQQLLVSGVWEKGANVASAATIALADGGYFHVTGTTVISDIDFAAPKDGRFALIMFDGALTLTHGANLLLPGAANIVTAAGDACLVVQDNGDAVKVAGFWRANGKAVVATSKADLGLATSTTDNAIIRADGTGGNTQNSTATIDDNGNVSFTRTTPGGQSDGIANFTSTDAGAASGPWVNVFRNSGSPAANDLMGVLAFSGKDDGGNQIGYSLMYGKILDPSAANKNGEFNFQAFVNNSSGDRVKISNGMLIGSGPAGGYQGAGSINAQLGYYSQGNLIADASGHLRLRSYTVGTLPSASAAGQRIYVTNEAGGATPAFSDGTNWRRDADRAVVS